MSRNRRGGGNRQNQQIPHTEQNQQDKPKLLHFKGKTYRLPDTADDWDLETLEAYERNHIAIAVSGMIGAQAWDEIKRSGAKVRDFKEIADQIAKAYDFESMGESQASSD